MIFAFSFVLSLPVSGVGPGQQYGGAGWWVAFGRKKRNCFGIAIGLGVFSLFFRFDGLSSTVRTINRLVPQVGGGFVSSTQYVYENL